ncbi:DNA-directed RNA polymerase subunit omega [Gammaproteobacteria bacterium]|jgi:DNA-directed RNA polymerase subunit omega|nr:DNA-directed RNA polymerase subunit omega [Gammaproteobacteria bacterium]
MSRVTAEDCRKYFKNRFALVNYAIHRAKKISDYEVKTSIDRQNHKPTVIALLEVKSGLVEEV